MKKRIIGILLCVALLVGMLPIISAVQAEAPDLSEYELVDLQYGYWYPSATGTANRFSTNDDLAKSHTLAGTRLFTKETLPVGSVINLASGWKYRPDGWVNYPATESLETRCAYVTDASVTVDAAWWGSYTSRAFNISRVDGAAFTIEEAEAAFEIVFPESAFRAKKDWAADGELSLIAIGNSFSDDALRWFCDIAVSAGITKVTVANLFIGGCKLITHYTNMQGNVAAYAYREGNDTTGYMVTESGQKTAQYGLTKHNWDFVTIQQNSDTSGLFNSYDELDDIIAYVRNLCPNAEIGWHMTWAFEGCADYGNNKDTMYRAIRGRVFDRILADNPEISFVIPSGTSVENARTAEGAGNYQRDGRHMDYALGRYILGMTYFCKVTGTDPADVPFTPDVLSGEHIRTIVNDAVRKSLDQPYEPSQNTGSFNVSLDGLTEIDYYVHNGFHDSSSDTTPLVTSDAKRCYTQLFTKETLPVGSVITLAPGFYCRADGWKVYGDAWSTGDTKPVEISAPAIVITEEWWGDFSVRGLNVHRAYNGNEGLDINVDPSDVKEAMHIYVPTAPLQGFEPVEVTLTSGYYNASSINGFVPAADAFGNRFFGTQPFTKQTLPVGSIIYLEEGWKYIPDGWTNYPTKNDGSYKRPGWVTAPGTVAVTEDWWGNYTTRTFNVKRTDDSVITGQQTEASVGFRIYVPGDNKDPKVELKSAQIGFGDTLGRDLYVTFDQNIALADGLKVVVHGANKDLSGADFESVSVMSDRPDTLCVKLAAASGYDSYFEYLQAQGRDAIVILSDDTGYGTAGDAVISAITAKDNASCKLHITNADESACAVIDSPSAPYIKRVYTYGDDYMYIEFNEPVDLTGEHWYSNLYMSTQSFSSTEPATAWVGPFHNNIINMGTGKTWAVHMEAGKLGDGITCWFNFRDAYPKHWTNFFLQDITPGKTLDGKCDFFVSKLTGLPLEANYDNPTNDTYLSPVLSYEPVSNAADAFARIKADTPVELSNGDYIIRNVKTGKLLKADTVRLESGGNNIYYLRNASDQYLNLYYSTGNWVDYKIGVKLRAVEGQDGKTCYQILIADGNQIRDLGTSGTDYAYAVLHDDFGEDLATLWTIDAPIETGDITGDHAIDVKDIVRLKKYLANLDYATKISTEIIVEDAADCNGDGKITIKDVVRLKRYIATQGAIPFGPLS